MSVSDQEKSDTLFLIIAVFFLGEILIDERLNAAHIRLRGEDFGEIRGRAFPAVITVGVGSKIKLGMERGVATEGIILPNGRFASDGAVSHEGGDVTGQHILMEAVLLRLTNNQ